MTKKNKPKKQFLYLLPEKERGEIMKPLYKELMKEVGPPCPDYANHCVVCEGWIAFDRLDWMFRKD